MTLYMTSRHVEVVLVPEFHDTMGQEILKHLTPFIKQIATSKHDIKNILNVSEGKGAVEADMSFFNGLYAPKTDYIHIHEWDETSPDVAYIECVKFVQTVITIINVILEAFMITKEGIDVKSFEEFPGVEGRSPPRNYIELVYTQMYHGHTFVPVEDVLCKELSAAFEDLYDGNTHPDVYNAHINTALRRLLEVLDEKNCRNKDILKSIVADILKGGDDDGRKEPILRARATTRELNDQRFIEEIHRYVSEHPDITLVIMNIGASHYINTVRLVRESRTLLFNKDMDAVVKQVYGRLGLDDMFINETAGATEAAGATAASVGGAGKGGPRRSSRRSTRRSTRRSIRKNTRRRRN